MSGHNEFKDCPVLVTGAAGCIGAWTVKLLSELDAFPVVFDLTENRQRLELIMKGANSITWELGDITDFDRLQEAAVHIQPRGPRVCNGSAVSQISHHRPAAPPSVIS